MKPMKSMMPPGLAVKMAENQGLVWEFQQAVSQAAYCFDLPVDMVLTGSGQKMAWQAFDANVNGEWTTFRHCSLREFIETPRPAGLGTTVDLFRRSATGSPQTPTIDRLLSEDVAIDGDAQEDHTGHLANNGMSVRHAADLFDKMPDRLKRVADALRVLIDAEAWKAFTSRAGGRSILYNDFRRFLEANAPNGCHTEADLVRGMVAGTDLAADVDRLLGASTV